MFFFLENLKSSQIYTKGNFLIFVFQSCIYLITTYNQLLNCTYKRSITINTRSTHYSYFYRTRVRSLFTLVTHSLTHSCLVNLINVSLACEDGNSKLVEVYSATYSIQFLKVVKSFSRLESHS